MKLVLDQLRCFFEEKQLNEVVAYLEDRIVAMEINVKYSDEIMFIDLYNIMPCCFSNCAFEILYPKSELTKEDIEAIQKILEVKIKMVHSRI